MELILQRVRLLPDRTAGQLYIDGTLFCFVVEDRVREVRGKPVSEWKVPHVTAIPEGRYKVILELSPKFGVDTLTLLNVPGFTGIRIHGGNTELDTDGCLIVGYQATEVGKIKPGTSKPALADLKVRVKKTLQAGQEIWIRVINPI